MHDDYRVYIQIQHELSVIADFATSWETDLRELPSEEESESEYHPKELLDKEFQEKIDKLLKDSLTECSFPNLTTARFNLSSFDVEINGRKSRISMVKDTHLSLIVLLQCHSDSTYQRTLYTTLDFS